MAKYFLQKIESAPHSVSLHVRRGDYLSSINAAIYYDDVISGYYRRAISSLEALFRYSRGLFSVFR